MRIEFDLSDKQLLLMEASFSAYLEKLKKYMQDHKGVHTKLADGDIAHIMITDILGQFYEQTQK